MPLREQDRAVWIGGAATSEPFDWTPTDGSSGKVREISPDGKRVLVDWGSGFERWCRSGRTRPEVVTCRQAANRGIEPWKSAYEEAKQRALLPRRRPRRSATSLLDLVPAAARPYLEKWQEYERQNPVE